MENLIIPRTEIEEDTDKWRKALCSWVGIMSIVEESMLPRAIYMFSAIPIRVLITFFMELEQITQGSSGATEDTEWLQQSGEGRVGGVTLPDVKLYTVAHSG